MQEQTVNNLQESILGILMLFPDELLNTPLSSVDFTGEYKKAFSYLVDNGGGDPLTVSNATGIETVVLLGWLDREGSQAYLKDYYTQLMEYTVKRRASIFASKIVSAESSEDIFKLVDMFQNNVSIKTNTDPRHISKGVQGLLKTLEKRYDNKGELLGMTTGIYDLDQKTEGLHKSDLVIIAGPSSMGKTALGINILEGVVGSGLNALVFSCEMTEEQLLMRVLSSQSRVKFNSIRATHKLRDNDWPKLTTAVGKMHNWNMFIDDPCGISVQEITRKIRKIHNKTPLDVVMIDYLQILKYDKDRENQALDEITVSLKNIAKELNICVVLLSQLNRRSETEQRKPRMTDLRGSGAIENHADVIIFPWRPAANCLQCQEGINNGDHDTATHQSKAEIIIGKQRQGERNISVPVLWIGEQVKFENLMR